MPVADGEIIYPSETFWFRIPRVMIDETLITSSAQVTNFQYEIFKNGVSQGPLAQMQPSSRVRGTWEAKITAPSTAGIYTIRAEVFNAAGRGSWQDTFTVTAFT